MPGIFARAIINFLLMNIELIKVIIIIIIFIKDDIDEINFDNIDLNDNED